VGAAELEGRERGGGGVGGKEGGREGGREEEAERGGERPVPTVGVPELVHQLLDLPRVRDHALHTAPPAAVSAPTGPGRVNEARALYSP
jgi:hypothetical protein